MINTRRGLNTWPAFVVTQKDTVIAGDVAMLESEITPVLKALRKNGNRHPPPHDRDYPVVNLLHYCGTRSG
jgi:hypothetical protein